MAQDPSLSLRQAIVTLLKTDVALLALVPADQQHGERADANPTFPFTRYGVADASPFKGQCMDGARIDVPIHCFSKSPFTDQANGINAAVASALDGKAVDLGGMKKAHLRWTGSTVMSDPVEAGVWHGIARFEATVS